MRLLRRFAPRNDNTELRHREEFYGPTTRRDHEAISFIEYMNREQQWIQSRPK